MTLYYTLAVIDRVVKSTALLLVKFCETAEIKSGYHFLSAHKAQKKTLFFKKYSLQEKFQKQ